MNHSLWNATAARVIAAMFLLAGLAACGEHLSNTASHTPKATPADASAVVVGTVPAQPSGDPPGTTPVASNTSDLTQKQESNGPQEGENNSHSTLAPDSPQKAGGSNPQQQAGRSNSK